MAMKPQRLRITCELTITVEPLSGSGPAEEHHTRPHVEPTATREWFGETERRERQRRRKGTVFQEAEPETPEAPAEDAQPEAQPT